MIWRNRGVLLSAVLAIGVMGCGGSNDSGEDPPGAGDDQGAAARMSEPAAAVHAFLEAVRTGNDPKAAEMLTATARQRTAQRNLTVSPPGSDTARFEVGRVEFLEKGAARVVSHWTDLDHTGQPRTDQMVWMVRREPEGWRIVGVAATVLEGEPPLILDFENPDEMLRKQQMLAAEVQRRAAQERLRARQGDPGDSIRR